MQRIERTFAGRRLVIETGRMAKQAAGSALVQFGETMVLAAVTVSDTESPLPFFPLLVEYKDKAYAAGKIPGGFIKREGRPSDPEILKARIIDRSIRPLFPEGFKNEVQVFIYVVSADQENDADVMALVAASYALNASKIPFRGPIGAVRVGRVQEKWILNPTFLAAAVQRHGHRSVGVEGLDHDGRGWRARSHRIRRARGTHCRTPWHPGAHPDPGRDAR